VRIAGERRLSDRYRRWFAFIVPLLAAAALAIARVRPAYCIETLNFPPSNFDILSVDTGKLIGHGRYTLERVTGGVLVRGENRYLAGEYDLEEDRMVATEERPLPVLTNFRHSFYRPDGTLLMEGRMDADSGVGSCGVDQAGKLSVKSEQFQFPPDTYAGVSILVPIQDFLRRGEGSGIMKLHVFTCAPGPRLPSVDVAPLPKTVAWPHYPGALIETDIKADFGFFTFVIAPFIPKLAAWFDPSSQWLLVGVQLERHYRGDKIILVRTREQGTTAPRAADAAPPAKGAPPR
jgi:hypothetical protein